MKRLVKRVLKRYREKRRNKRRAMAHIGVRGMKMRWRFRMFAMLVGSQRAKIFYSKGGLYSTVDEVDVLRKSLQMQGEALFALKDRLLAMDEENGLFDKIERLEAHGGDLARQINDVSEQINRETHATSRSVDGVADRIEFVRLELMYELQDRCDRIEAGLTSASKPAAAALPSRPEIQRNPATIAALNQRARESDLALNVGCGHKPLREFINVDLRDLPNVDLQAAADDIPLEKGAIARIYSAHLLEHFTEQTLLRRILPHWFELLRPGGVLTSVVPDSPSMMRAWMSDEMSFDDLRLVTYGQQEYQGDFHYTMFSPESLCDLLGQAGFKDAVCLEQNRVNGLCREFEVQAIRP